MRYFIIRNRFKQDRTPSGGWSRRTYDHEREAMSAFEYGNATSPDTLRFFSARATRSYTKAGYMVTRAVLPVGWNAGTRMVEDYTLVEIPREAFGARGPHSRRGPIRRAPHRRRARARDVRDGVRRVRPLRDVRLRHRRAPLRGLAAGVA